MPQHAASVVAAFVRTVFTQPDEPSARAQLRAVAERLATSFPTAAGALLAPEDDVLADLACPREHRPTIWSTIPLEWHNRELARRNDVVGIVLNRLGTTLLVEQDDEWLTMAKHCLPKISVTRLLSGVPGTTLAELLKEAMAVGEVTRLGAHLHHLTGHDLALLGPADGSVFSHYPRTSNLRRSPVWGDVSYRVEIQFDGTYGRTPTPPSPWWTGGSFDSTTTEYTFDFVGAQLGRRRVAAADHEGRSGPSSDWWYFRYTV